MIKRYYTSWLIIICAIGSNLTYAEDTIIGGAEGETKILFAYKHSPTILIVVPIAIALLILYKFSKKRKNK